MDPSNADSAMSSNPSVYCSHDNKVLQPLTQTSKVLFALYPLFNFCARLGNCGLNGRVFKNKCTMFFQNKILFVKYSQLDLMIFIKIFYFSEHL